jgi:hypothetical protein
VYPRGFQQKRGRCLAQKPARERPETDVRARAWALAATASPISRTGTSVKEAGGESSRGGRIAGAARGSSTRY